MSDVAEETKKWRKETWNNLIIWEISWLVEYMKKEVKKKERCEGINEFVFKLEEKERRKGDQTEN